MAVNARKRRLSQMLKPRAIAFVGGAAVEPSIAYARALGFSGELHVINPKREKLSDITCVRSASELATPPDLAFVAVPGANVIDAIADLARAGVGAAIVNSSGFSETGDAGTTLEAGLLAAAGEMPIIGPNCPGLANFLDRASAMLDHLGDSHAARGVAVISNGGAYLADIACSDRSLPIAYLAGLGNQADVSVAELLDVILDDDRVSAVNLHLESIRDVARLSRCALKAHQKGIPVVALKVGRSIAGQRAARSHTASIAGDAVIASALLHRFGFIEVESTSEALETLKMLALAAAPRGARVGIATSSGTYAVMASDFAEKNGLQLPPASDATRAALGELLPGFLVPDNPLDIATVQFEPLELQQQIFSAFLQDDYDLALQTMSFPPANTWEDSSWYVSAEAFARAAAAANLPAIFVSPVHEGLPRAARERLLELGVVPLQGYTEGMRAIAHALDWHRRRRLLIADNLLLPDAPPPTGAPIVSLDEIESKALLAGFGIPVPRGQRWSPERELSDEIRFPVVLKVCDAAIAHKSGLGGVSLNLGSLELLRFACNQMSNNLQREGIAVTSFLVEEAVLGGIAELLVGIQRVPQLGYSLTLGSGGSAVEQMSDTVTLLLPCNRDAITEALQQLALYPLLDGERSGLRADIDTALDAIETISGFVLSRSDIVELEINPMIVRAEGQGVVAVDAVMSLHVQ